MREAWSRLTRLIRGDRRWPIALALFACTYLFFVGPAAWNQNSRLALTRAMVERRAFDIDPDHPTTGDKSYREETGHFYSDKAPGASWLALPAYSVFYGVKRVSGGELPGTHVEPLDPLDAEAGRRPAPADRLPGDRLVYNPAHRIASYLCRVTAVVPLSLLALAAMYLLGLRVTGSRDKALATALLFGLGTPALAYSCGFYGHQPAAAALFLAFCAPILLHESTRGAALLTGAALGLAVCCEYTTAIPTLAIVAWAAARRGLRFGGFVVAGGVPFAIALAAYHTLAFGTPLSTGYDHVFLPEFAEGMRVRYGLGAPDPSVLAAITFGSYRGLFYVAPVTILAAWGLGALAWRPRLAASAEPGFGRPEFGLAAFIVVYYLLLNAGYYMWDGGAALGPRHCVPALPFLALGFWVVIDVAPRACAVLGLASGVAIATITAAGPEAPTWEDPLWAYGVPELFAGPGSAGSATTVGELVGLPAWASLALLLALWGVLLVRLRRTPAE